MGDQKKPVPSDKLKGLTTEGLIEEYGYTVANPNPFPIGTSHRVIRDRRSRIVDLISNRADQGDQVALGVVRDLALRGRGTPGTARG